MTPSAIIFDLDGTLVDTIPLWTRAYMQVFEDFGAVISREEFIANIYVPSLSLKGAMQLKNIPLEHEPAFRRKRDERYVALLQSEAEWIPQVLDVLIALQRKLPTAVATGSHRIYTDALNSRLQLYSHTQCTLTCDDVRHGKPAPDMLLLAAEQLGTPPEECVYVGDQLFDVEAAKAAGMRCWLVPNMDTPVRAFAEADLILEQLAEILAGL